jgi:predicted component of viral defense system (DUF524 family)
MTDKSTILKAFNTLFFDFIEDILTIFPENEDIRVSKEFFTTVKRANPTALLKSWYTYVYSPYASIIDSGNIDFFFNKNYEDDLNVLSNAKDIMKAIDTIREPVRNMSEVNKAHSMKYIQKLSTLSTMYK